MAFSGVKHHFVVVNCRGEKAQEIWCLQRWKKKNPGSSAYCKRHRCVSVAACERTAASLKSGWWFGNVWNIFLCFHLLGIIKPPINME
jgi:hypothetical protein